MENTGCCARVENCMKFSLDTKCTRIVLSSIGRRNAYLERTVTDYRWRVNIGSLQEFLQKLERFGSFLDRN